MKKADEMRQELEVLKNEAQILINDGKVNEAKAKMEELKQQKDLIAAQEVLDQENMEALKQEDAVKSRASKEKKDIFNAFGGLIRAGIRKETPKEEDLEVYNATMTEGQPADGGLTVPQDISTKINTLRRSEDALEPLVNVESVNTLTGSRVYEVHADQVPFDNVDEAEEFPEFSNPQFQKIDYVIKKKGGILKLTRELLQDTAENLMSFVARWIGKKAKATRNAMIVKLIEATTAGKEVPIAAIDDLKDIFNVKLDPAIALTAKVVTNQDGFNYLDKLKDSDGNYILQKNPTDPTKRMLFGRHRVVVIGNKVLKTTDGKIPVICGDLKEAITIFDREHMTIEFSTEAGDLWNKDLTGIKVRERLDIKAIDPEAIIMGQIAAGSTSEPAMQEPTAPDPPKTYTQSELEEMTVEQLKALAAEKGYAITKTIKAEIIAEIIAQQE